MVLWRGERGRSGRTARMQYRGEGGHDRQLEPGRTGSKKRECAIIIILFQSLTPQCPISASHLIDDVTRDSSAHAKGAECPCTSVDHTLLPTQHLLQQHRQGIGGDNGLNCLWRACPTEGEREGGGIRREEKGGKREEA